MEHSKDFFNKGKEVNEKIIKASVETMRESIRCSVKAQKELTKTIEDQIHNYQAQLEFYNKVQGHFVDMVEKNLRGAQEIFFGNLQGAFSQVYPNQK